MVKIGVVPNEEFSSYFPQFSLEKRERYFNPNLRFETHIISFDEKGYKPGTRIGTLVVHPVSRLPQILIRHFWRFLKTSWIIRRHKLKLVRSYNAFQYGLVSMLAARINRVPFVVSLHNDYDSQTRLYKKNYFVWHNMEKIVIRNASAVIAISPYLCNYATEHGARNVILIPNPLNLGPFLRECEDAQSIRTKYNLNHKVVLLFVGRYYDPQKNFSRLLQAFSQLERGLQEKAHLLVMGRGRDKETYYKRLVSQLSLTEKVTFVGFLPHAELPAYYHASDIFLIPSIYEGLPNSLIEAMASGLPCLVSNHPSFIYLVDSECGVIVNPYDVQEIARGLRYLIQMDEHERKKLGSKARMKVVTLFDEKKTYDQLEKLYLDLLKEGG